MFTILRIVNETNLTLNRTLLVFGHMKNKYYIEKLIVHVKVSDSWLLKRLPIIRTLDKCHKKVKTIYLPVASDK